LISISIQKEQEVSYHIRKPTKCRIIPRNTCTQAEIKKILRVNEVSYSEQLVIYQIGGTHVTFNYPQNSARELKPSTTGTYLYTTLFLRDYPVLPTSENLAAISGLPRLAN
jgi:hypothetical protein